MDVGLHQKYLGSEVGKHWVYRVAGLPRRCTGWTLRPCIGCCLLPLSSPLPLSLYGLYLLCTRVQIVQCCYRRGNGRFPRHASESRARSVVAAAHVWRRSGIPFFISPARRLRLTERLPPPLSLPSLSFPSAFARLLQTHAHTHTTRVRRAVGDSVRHSPPPHVEGETRHEFTPLSVRAAGERVIGSRTPSTCPRTFTATYPRNPPFSPPPTVASEEGNSLSETESAMWTYVFLYILFFFFFFISFFIFYFKFTEYSFSITENLA